MSYDHFPLNLSYRILGVDPQASNDQLKNQFKHLVLRTHPDKGGDAQEFELVKKAFASIWHARRVRDLSVEIDVQQASQQRHVDLQEMLPAQSETLFLDSKAENFDLARFNQVFSEVYEPAPEHKGYDDFMRSGEVHTRELIVYEEPVQLVGTRCAYQELGNDGSNFTFDKGTDLREAYSNRPENELPPVVERDAGQWEQYKQQREQAIIASDEDARRLQRITEWREKMESERQQRVHGEELRIQQLDQRLRGRLTVA
jgi:hypothetical protein